MRLTRLKWMAIVAPVAFLGVVGYLVQGPFHEELHHFPGYLYVLAVLTVAVSGFSFFVFAIIERVERRVVEQNEQLSALLAVGQAVTSSRHVADALDAALDTILGVTSAEAVELWLVDDDGRLTLTRRRGAVVESDPEQTLLPVRGPDENSASATGSELSFDVGSLRERADELGFASFCAQPFSRRGATAGLLAVASHGRGALGSDSERRLLEGIGEQLAIAVENAELHERVLDEAVLEERERIAHELHDGLAQVLGYVNTQALAIDRLIASGRNEEAGQQVRAMREAARGVYADVREAILGLRARDKGLLPSLRSYLGDYGRMTGTIVTLELGPEVEDLRLPSSIEFQLVRIVQEALTNVRKHAAASGATVSLRLDDGALRVDVRDEGRGFDLDQPIRTGWPHFGLQTMRERAQAIGGTLELSSKPGSGTCVTVLVPLAEATEVRSARSAR